MNKRTLSIIKIITAVLLFLALMEMPYGYYQFLRIAVFVSALVCAYQSYRLGTFFTIIFAVIAILFNPVFPIYLSREVWQPVDVGVGMVFLVSVFERWINKLFKSADGISKKRN